MKILISEESTINNLTHIRMGNFVFTRDIQILILFNFIREKFLGDLEQLTLCIMKSFSIWMWLEAADLAASNFKSVIKEANGPDSQLIQ